MIENFYICVDDTETENTSISKPYGCNEIPCISEIKNLIEHLTSYVNTHSDKEIEQENDRRYANHHEKVMSRLKTCAGGYVYLFECGGKYKIGVSNNVNRRIKDLDKRPFKVNLITKIYSEMAYKVEGTIHTCLKAHKIEGEWYDFPTPPTAEWFESLVKRVEDDKRRANE